jgi:hypothetical protein
VVPSVAGKHNTILLVNKCRAPGRPGDNVYGPPNTLGSQNELASCHTSGA